jgi:DNA-binding transcriptional ArsR family regulator
MQPYLSPMRPLLHPAIEDVTVAGILHALADPIRLRIFADLMQADAAMGCSPYLQIGDRSISKSTISQHFKVLREAGLIRSERKGPGLLSITRWTELKPRFGALIEALLQAYREEEESVTASTRRPLALREKGELAA